ncbi:hypothetical protein F4703DRAFT_1914333 [Phycomyces blakesleeanus]
MILMFTWPAFPVWSILPKEKDLKQQFSCVPKDTIVSLSPNVLFTAYNIILSTKHPVEIRKVEDKEADFVELEEFSCAYSFIYNSWKHPLEDLPPWLWGEKSDTESLQDRLYPSNIQLRSSKDRIQCSFDSLTNSDIIRETMKDSWHKYRKKLTRMIALNIAHSLMSILKVDARTYFKAEIKTFMKIKEFAGNLKFEYKGSRKETNLRIQEVRYKWLTVAEMF